MQIEKNVPVPPAGRSKIEIINDMEIGDIIWLLLKKCIGCNNIVETEVSDVLIDTYTFLQYYNNNYRPIYHLEKYLYNLINRIHGFK